MIFPLISVLIPVYNRMLLVGKAIESAINQTYKNIEIIIVDNYSTDGTWDILSLYSLKDKRIKIFQNKINIGPVKNWERCLQEATGEYAFFLWSDDVISENFIESSIKIFDNDTAFVLNRVNYFDDKCLKKGFEMSSTKLLTYNYLNDRLLLNRNGFPLSPSAAIFRLKDLRENLIIDIDNPLGLDFKKYGAGNDLLFYLFIANKYKYIKYNHSAVAYYRMHDGSFSCSNDLNIYYFWAKWLFIAKFYSQLKREFKTHVFCKMNHNPTLNQIYNLVDSKLSILFLFKCIINKIIVELISIYK